MTLLSVAEFREHVTTPLVDDALQRLLDASEAEIDQEAGALGSTTELAFGSGRYIFLARPASAFASVTETWGSTATVLAADDYLVHPGGLLLERLSTGTNSRSRWWGQVAVIYTPADDTDIRIGVQLDLMQLMLNFIPGVSMEQVGAWTRQLAANSAWNNSEERGSILSRLAPEPQMVVVG